LWNTDPVQVTQTSIGLDIGTYTVTVTQLSNCTEIISVNITDPGSPVIDSIVSNNITCGGSMGDNGSAIAYVTAPISKSSLAYSWSTIPEHTGSSVSGLAADTYTLVITDTTGCYDSDTVVVKADPKPEIELIATDEKCNDKNGDISVNILTGNEPFKYFWSNGSNEQSLNNIGSGAYQLNVIDSNNCWASDTAVVNNKGGIEADFLFFPFQKITIEDPVVEFAENCEKYTPEKLTWDFGDMNYDFDRNKILHTYEQPGIYEVTLEVEDKYGCIDDTTKILEIEDVYAFYAPNSFTPNSKGGNEIWLPKGNNINSYSYELRVFDRWGGQLFYTTDLNEGWNGTLNNVGTEIAKQGVYVYRVIYINNDERRFEHVGSINLIK